MKAYALIGAASLLLLTSCAQQALWMKPGASTDEFNQDKYACLQQSQQPASTAYFGRYGGGASSGVITNGGLYGACMNSRGWFLTSVTDTKAYSDAMKPVMEEQQQACLSSQLQPIFARKMSCKAADTTPQQLADKAKATVEEKAALVKWRSVLDDTNKKVAEIDRQFNSKSGQAIAEIVESGTVESDKLVMDLQEGRLSWGEYNRRRAEGYKQYLDRLKIALQ